MFYLPKIESHFIKLIAVVDSDNPMWPSIINIQTGLPPAGDHIPKRVYRLIGAPNGSTLYWDQPMIDAAYILSELTGNQKYAQSADGYVQFFLTKSISPSGMFQWGNHQYYDLVNQETVSFSNGYHELRPITPIWNIFWRLAPKQTENYIRIMAHRHVYDPQTGGFNRHDDGKKGHAFLEAGGILVESLAWLYSKILDEELLEQALRIARYSYQHRDPGTGLVRNEPDFGRWDSKVCTSEIGLWAQSLLRAGNYTSNNEFIEMAQNAVQAFLKHAYDKRTGAYYGQVAVENGKPETPADKGHCPRLYSDPWNTDQWPTHDYSMPLVEACLTLHTLTHEQVFVDAIHNWIRIVIDTSPGQTGKWAYAESYGQSIHFLMRAGKQLGDESISDKAYALADEAVNQLYEDGMFQGYQNSHFYESVDGVGYLLLSLMLLEKIGGSLRG